MLLGTLLAVGLADAARAETARPVVIGEEFTLYSNALNEERTVFVAKPGSYDRGNDDYAVLFLLDGRNPFYYISGIAKFLAASDRIPELLIVGIDNPPAVRARDLTPPASDPVTLEREPLGGGAAQFRRFIAEELMPWVRQNYRTRPYQVLIGHSYGGLFAIDTLIDAPALFDAYVAISPSLAWDAGRVVERAAASFRSGAGLDARLYLTMGNDARGLRAGVRNLAGALEGAAPAGLDWHFKHLPDESHVSVALGSVHRGLEYVFDDWRLDDPMGTFERYGMQAVEHFYSRSAAKYGRDPAVPREIVGELCRELLAAGRLEEVDEVLAGNRAGVQAPPRFLIALADAWRARGRVDRAVAWYRAALEGSPGNELATRALAELGAR